MSDRRADAGRPGNSYLDDTYYLPIEGPLEQKYGLPDGLLSRIRKFGEKTDRDRVSPAGAQSVYQIIPSTRNAFLRMYGVNAYAGDEQAAQVAALHLKESLDRSGGDLEQAVHEYVGGTNKAAWGPVTAAYADRVLGRKAPGIVAARGSTATAPGFDWRNIPIDQLQGVNASDIGNAQPLGPKPITEKDVAPKTTAGELILGEAGISQNTDITPGSTTPDISGDVAVEQAAVSKEAAKPGWFDRLKAAVDKNWASQMIVRGLDNEFQNNYEGDPAWHKEYLKNRENYESVAQDQDELDMLRGYQAQNSKDGYYSVVRQIEARRARNQIIDSNGTGWAYDLGTSFLDPAGWVAMAGIGKLAQIGKVGVEAAEGAKIAAQAAKPTLMSSVATGAGVNVGYTALQDYSGESETVGDYLQSAALGLAMGAAFHGVSHLGGEPDVSDAAATKAYNEAVAQEAASVAQEATVRVGPNATPAEHQQAQMEVVADRAERILSLSVADRADTDRFLPAEGDLSRLQEGDREQAILDNNLDSLPDPTERALAAEMATRARDMVEEAKASGTLDKGLEGRFLKVFGQESDALRLIRSGNPTLQAVAIQLLESTTGAGGRKASAAISMFMRQKAYLQHMVDYDDAFDLWRKGEGIGAVSASLGTDARKRFNSLVFDEVEGRGRNALPNPNKGIQMGADAWEAGMDKMRKEMQRVGTVGHERLGDTSVGYMRHMMDPRKLMALNSDQRRFIEKVMAKQFRELNEYSYTLRADGKEGPKGTKITKKFDTKFSNKLAKKYLSEALARGKGSNFIPANLNTSDSASIVADALKEIQGLAPEEKDAILGKFSRGGPSFTKGRLKLDLSADIGNGMQLGDLFNKDIDGLYRSYARRVAGEVSLAQYGILGKPGLQMIRKIADLQGADVKDLQAFERVSSEFLGEPWSKEVNMPWARDLRALASSTQLGGLGFTELGQLGDAVHSLGIRAVLSMVPGAKRLRMEASMLGRDGAPKSKILGDIEAVYGHIGGDGYQMQRIFDRPDNDIELYDQRSISTASRIIRAGSHFTSVFSGFRMIHAVMERHLAEMIAKKAIRYIHLGRADKALDEMGINAEIRAAFKADMDNVAKFDAKGNLTELNLINSNVEPRAVQDFAQAIMRGSGQILMKTYIGETGPWAHNDLLKLLLQFRTFGITSIEKQFGRQRAAYGPMRAFATMIGSMAFALPIHLARLQVQSLGLTRSQREKFFKERANIAALTQATLQYTSASGLLPDALDLLSTFGSKSGLLPAGAVSARGSTTGVTLGTLSPGVGYVDKVLNDTVGGKFRKLPRLLPGGNLPQVIPIFNNFDPPGAPASTSNSTTQAWDAGTADQ